MPAETSYSSRPWSKFSTTSYSSKPSSASSYKPTASSNYTGNSYRPASSTSSYRASDVSSNNNSSSSNYSSSSYRPSTASSGYSSGNTSYSSTKSGYGGVGSSYSRSYSRDSGGSKERSPSRDRNSTTNGYNSRIYGSTDSLRRSSLGKSNNNLSDSSGYGRSYTRAVGERDSSYNNRVNGRGKSEEREEGRRRSTSRERDTDVSSIITRRDSEKRYSRATSRDSDSSTSSLYRTNDKSYLRPTTRDKPTTSLFHRSIDTTRPILGRSTSRESSDGGNNSLSRKTSAESASRKSSAESASRKSSSGMSTGTSADGTDQDVDADNKSNTVAKRIGKYEPIATNGTLDSDESSSSEDSSITVEVVDRGTYPGDTTTNADQDSENRRKVRKLVSAICASKETQTEEKEKTEDSYSSKSRPTSLYTRYASGSSYNPRSYGSTRNYGSSYGGSSSLSSPSSSSGGPSWRKYLVSTPPSKYSSGDTVSSPTRNHDDSPSSRSKASDDFRSNKLKKGEDYKASTESLSYRRSSITSPKTPDAPSSRFNSPLTSGTRTSIVTGSSSSTGSKPLSDSTNSPPTSKSTNNTCNTISTAKTSAIKTLTSKFQDTSSDSSKSDILPKKTKSPKVSGNTSSEACTVSSLSSTSAFQEKIPNGEVETELKGPPSTSEEKPASDSSSSNNKSKNQSGAIKSKSKINLASKKSDASTTDKDEKIDISVPKTKNSSSVSKENDSSSSCKTDSKSKPSKSIEKATSTQSEASAENNKSSKSNTEPKPKPSGDSSSSSSKKTSKVNSSQKYTRSNSSKKSSESEDSGRTSEGVSSISGSQSSAPKKTSISKTRESSREDDKSKGLVVTPGNKECRKSVLNMNITETQKTELMRKQEELRELTWKAKADAKKKKPGIKKDEKEMSSSSARTSDISSAFESSDDAKQSPKLKSKLSISSSNQENGDFQGQPDYESYSESSLSDDGEAKKSDSFVFNKPEKNQSSRDNSHSMSHKHSRAADNSSSSETETSSESENEDSRDVPNNKTKLLKTNCESSDAVSKSDDASDDKDGALWVRLKQSSSDLPWWLEKSPSAVNKELNAMHKPIDSEQDQKSSDQSREDKLSRSSSSKRAQKLQRLQSTSEVPWWLQGSDSKDSESTEDRSISKKDEKRRQILNSSSNIPWWLQSGESTTDNDEQERDKKAKMALKILRSRSGSKDSESTDSKYAKEKKRKQLLLSPSTIPIWLQSSESTTDNDEHEKELKARLRLQKLNSESNMAWWMQTPEESEAAAEESDEIVKARQRMQKLSSTSNMPWWLQNNEEGGEVSNQETSDDSKEAKARLRLQKLQSASDMPWWMQNSGSSSNVISQDNSETEKLTRAKKRMQKLLSDSELPWWLKDNETSETSSKSSKSDQKSRSGKNKTTASNEVKKVSDDSSDPWACWQILSPSRSKASKDGKEGQKSSTETDESDTSSDTEGERVDAYGRLRRGSIIQCKHRDMPTDTSVEDFKAGRKKNFHPRVHRRSYKETTHRPPSRTQKKLYHSRSMGHLKQYSRTTGSSSGENESKGKKGVLPTRVKRKPSSSDSTEETSSAVEMSASDVKVHEGSPPRSRSAMARTITPGDNYSDGNLTTPIVSPYPPAQDNDETIDDDDKNRQNSNETPIEDAALQVYKDGDFGTYLDLESTVDEQAEEFEGVFGSHKNSVVLRSQLSVRVHAIIEKLLTSKGRELRRALFALKQIFQDDKDLVHEFVQNDGLACLIKVGSETDQNYQNYILRALGQVMLYVDGMNGMIQHNETVQWLYSLVKNPYRLVVKTALKLLLVFTEYAESNAQYLVKAVHVVDKARGLTPWSTLMALLQERDTTDWELLVFAMSLMNKVLNGVPDVDSYYDQIDCIEALGMQQLIQRYMSRQGADLDLLQQFHIYETVIKYEDGDNDDDATATTLEALINNRMISRSRRKSEDAANNRRRSHRFSLGEIVLPPTVLSHPTSPISPTAENPPEVGGVGVTPGLRRRRERAERHRSFMREQEEARHDGGEEGMSVDPDAPALVKQDSSIMKKSWQLGMMYSSSKNQQPGSPGPDGMKDPFVNEQNQKNEEDSRNHWRSKEGTVKDLQEKLTSSSNLQQDETKGTRTGDVSGLISRTKEELTKSRSKPDLKLQSPEANVPKPELTPPQSESDLQWEKLIQTLDRPFKLCDMDFSDLVADDDDACVGSPVMQANLKDGPPPPPMPGAPPPPPLLRAPPPPPLKNHVLETTKTAPVVKKNKKTIKLFWREVSKDPYGSAKLREGTLWDQLGQTKIDHSKLEHLFENRAKDLGKKQQEMKSKEISVLDPKRSNAINIALTKLPPVRTIKTAILKMDATIMNREGVEKLLFLIPSEEESARISEACCNNPDIPLGNAEKFLSDLASITELPQRLKLWAFRLDFDNVEKEIAEPLMDLKQGMDILQTNKTFRLILSTLLAIGNFLNGSQVRGFHVEYLSKVPEVKDTVHKHSLLHHLCHMVMEQWPESTDLYSEIGPVTRASKVDFTELASNLEKLEVDCKESWDHLRDIAKHDSSTAIRNKMSEFLVDAAERIILLKIIHRRVMNRFRKFLLWLGMNMRDVIETKANVVCKVVSEFALEYRTMKERVAQQRERKHNHRERNKTRGRMITEVGKFKSRETNGTGGGRDAELRQLLGSDKSDAEGKHRTLRRVPKQKPLASVEDGDDGILESLVKTATTAPPPRTTPRDRKRSRFSDRKSPGGTVGRMRL